MQAVWIMGNVEDALGVVRCAKTLQDAYSFDITPQQGSIPLRLEDRQGDTLFTAHLERGVSVSTSESRGICTYTGLPRDMYLLTASMLGVLRYRALWLNPLLCEEDCMHEAPCWCLCARRLFIEEFALAFETPRVCRACWSFYETLCPPDEVAAARGVLKHTAELVAAARSLPAL